MVSQSAATDRVSPLASVNISGVSAASGISAARAGVSIREIRSPAIVQVFAQQGKAGLVAAALGTAEDSRRASMNDSFTVMPLGPDQWMLTSETGSDGSFRREIQSTLDGVGYVSEQSHGRVIIRVSGANVRQVMQKGCRLDLHPDVTGVGFCATTPMAQVGVLLHQVDNTPTYDLHVYSGFARSFWHWLCESAAEFGYTIEQNEPLA